LNFTLTTLLKDELRAYQESITEDGNDAPASQMVNEFLKTLAKKLEQN